MYIAINPLTLILVNQQEVLYTFYLAQPCHISVYKPAGTPATSHFVKTTC